MWFVDKLGPAPGAESSQPPARANGAAQAQSQRAPAKGASPPKPEKKKKKGWF
jgi:hypothetical protein